MSPELLSALTVFVLAILVGFAVISKVPATLHTPLMSGANSIHGIVLVGAMFIAVEADDPVEPAPRRSIAVAFATMNVVGGYVVTDRMLQMFKRRSPRRRSRPTRRRAERGLRDDHRVLVRLAWLGRRVCVRPRPDADELAGDGPQRQPPVGRRAWSSRSSRRRSSCWPGNSWSATTRSTDSAGRSSSSESRSAAASGCTRPGP